MSHLVVKIKDVCEFVRGLTYSKRDEVEYSNNAVLRATNIDLNSNRLNLDEIRYIDNSVSVKEDKKVRVGDILICTASGSKSHLGKVAFIEEPIDMAFGGFMGVLRAKPNINPKYLFLFFKSELFLRHVFNTSDGANINNLKFSQFEDLEITLPSLPIQRKIVAKLDAIFAEIDKAMAAADANSKNADLLVKGTITTLINKFSERCFVKFGDICGFIRGPFGGSLKKSIFVENGYAVYEQQHPINNQFDTFRYFITDEKFNEMKRFEVFPHDLLMSCSGVTLGKIAIVPKGAPKGIINQALLKITPKDNVRKDYLKLIMESDYFQSILWDVSGGAAQPNVPSVKVIKDFLIPLPTINEQDDFIDIVSSVLSYNLSSIYKEKKKSLISLKQSFLKQAFNGELVRE